MGKKKGNKNHVGSHITRPPVPLLTTTGDVVSLSISADCIEALYLCLNIDTRRQEAVFGLSCGSSTRKKTPLHVTQTTVPKEIDWTNSAKIFDTCLSWFSLFFLYIMQVNSIQINFQQTTFYFCRTVADRQTEKTERVLISLFSWNCPKIVIQIEGWWWVGQQFAQ